MPPSSTVRIPAATLVLSPLDGLRQLQFDVDPASVPSGCIAPPASYLEFTLNVEETLLGTPLSDIRLKGAGALSLLSSIRIASSRNGQVFDELTGGDAAMWFDFLWRHCYTDAQRETLGRLFGASTDFDMRTPFANPSAATPATAPASSLTVRIPLPMLSGLFRAPVLNLTEIGGLNISSQLASAMETAFESVNHTPDDHGAIINIAPPVLAAKDFSAGGADRKAVPTSAALSAAYVDAITARVASGGPIKARLAYANATDPGPTTFTVEEVEVAAASTTAGTGFTLVADLPATSQFTGSIDVMPYGGVACGELVNGAAPLADAALTTLADMDADQLEMRGIVVGTKLYARLAITNCTPGTPPTTPVNTFWPAAAGSTEPCIVTKIEANGSKMKLTFDRSLGAANTTYTGGAALHLFPEAPFISRSTIDGGTYSVSNPALVLAEAPEQKVAPFAYTAVQAQTTPVALNAPAPSAIYSGIPCTAAFAAITRFWTDNEDRATAAPVANGTQTFAYRLNGEDMVENGPVEIGRFDPIPRREIQRAINAIPGYASQRAPGACPDTLAVALAAPGGGPCDLSSGTLELRTSAQNAEAGYMTTFIPHLRACSVGPSGVVVQR